MKSTWACRVPAATFQEQARAEYLRSLFRDLGYGAQIDEAGNVIAPIIFDKKQPYVAVTAHMDTVIAPRGRGDVSVQPDGTSRHDNVFRFVVAIA